MNKGNRNDPKIFTDETLLELTQHGRDEYPFRYYLENIWEFDFHCIDWHWHAEVEFIYVEKGTAICYIGTEKLQLTEGSALFVNSRAIHRFEAQTDVIIPNIVFSPVLLAAKESLLYGRYIRPVIEEGRPSLVFDPAVGWQKECILLLLDVFAAQEEEQQTEMKTVYLLLKLWDILYAHFLPEHPHSARSDFSTGRMRLQIMMQFIHEHFREKLTLKDIAASVSVSPSSAQQIFTSGLHQSPVAYLITYRLKYAANLLASTERKISAIAEETGFSSSEYFCRMFRKLFHMTPNDYRKTAKDGGRH